MGLNPTSQRWREVRKFLGFTQPEFAERLGMTQAAVSLIESGKTKNPSIDLINRLFSTFPEINKDWFFTGNGTLFHGPNEKKVKDIMNEKFELELPENYKFDPVMKEYMEKVKILVASLYKEVESLQADKVYLQSILKKEMQKEFAK